MTLNTKLHPDPLKTTANSFFDTFWAPKTRKTQDAKVLIRDLRLMLSWLEFVTVNFN